MNEKYSIPGSILLAGIIIAGAIFLSRSPFQGGLGSGGLGETPSPAPIVLRDVDPAKDHIRGKVDAPITIVEYSDTECPFCKSFHPTLKRVIEEYDGKVRWVYRHFPLDQLHPKARKESEATECANEQGKFWEYLDRIYEVTPSNDGLDPKQLPVIANDVGLNVAAFETCLASGKYASAVEADVQDAISAGGQGTPHSIIITPNGDKLPFSGAQKYESLKSILDTLSAT